MRPTNPLDLSDPDHSSRPGGRHLWRRRGRRHHHVGDTGTTNAPATTEATTGTTAGAETTVASGEPIRVGGTLALTGVFAPTAAIDKATGDVFVERVNASGGILGRPVEWVLLDDESTS
ncbi:MAG TPA: ABC transporter substrate-binding protein, partial [Acidimicrobiia bacterium]